MGDQPPTPDASAARIASRQHGVLTTLQLAGAGIGKHGVSHRVRTGRLHRLHRGVYAVGQPKVSTQGKWMAAVLAGGEGAVLSHQSAAGLWRLLPAAGGWAHVTVSASLGRRQRKGIWVHGSRTLSPSLSTIRHGIPVTKPSRTIDDLRSVVSPEDNRRAIRQAEFLGYPLGVEIERDGTRSKLEYRFLRLCRRHGIPLPEVNVRVDRFLVDFLWRDHGLVIETDGWKGHRGRQAFEDDRQRDLELRLLGYEVIRFTYRQVTADPDRVAAALRALLPAGACS